MASKKELRERIRRQDRAIIALTDALESARILLAQARAERGATRIVVPYVPPQESRDRGMFDD